LVRANDYNEQAAIYAKQLDAQKAAVAELKGKRDLLKSKYDSAQRNKEMLVARARAAQAKSDITKATTQAGSVDYSSELERMERKIREQEARADATAEMAESQTSVEDEFAKLGDDQQVEEQLAALKAKMGK
jgi:phage shock protein A